MFGRALLTTVFANLTERFLETDHIVHNEDGMIFMTASYFCQNYYRVPFVIYDHLVHTESTTTKLSFKAVRDMIMVYKHLLEMGLIDKTNATLLTNYIGKAKGHSLYWLSVAMKDIKDDKV